MKIVGNLDATGNIKLRGRVLDKLVTDGGFYSRSYGEVAYKSDLGQDAGSVVQNFYGLVVKETQAPAATYKGINTINFDANFFYLSQNAPNTDEVVVNLRESPRTKVLYRSGMRHLRNEPTHILTGTGVEHVLLKFIIPANTFPEKILRITIFGYQSQTNASDNQDLYITMNNRVIYNNNACGITAINAPISSKYVGHLAMTEPDPSYLMFHMITNKSNTNSGSDGVGTGTWNTGTNASDGYGGSFHIKNIDPTIDQEFKMSFFDLGTGNEFYVMSSFVEEI